MSRLLTSTVFFLSTFFVFSSASMADGRLPEHKGLGASVSFWEDIFSKYKPTHCIIHDRNDLSSIFIVKNISTNRKKSRKQIKTYKKEVKTALLRLAKRGYAKTSLEKRVVKGIEKRNRNKKYYKRAAYGVRCQRGVDISPSIKRSQQYIGMIKKVFKYHGIPEDLAYLPHLESGFQRYVRSKVGARGIWQFMPQTARQMGLTVKRKKDNRTNPYYSTVAAAKHLKKLYKTTGSWPLAITAYNYGVNGMRRAVKKYGKNYMKIRKYHKTRIFGFAVKNYYPSFLAVRNVASKYNSKRVAKRKQNTARL